MAVGCGNVDVKVEVTNEPAVLTYEVETDVLRSLVSQCNLSISRDVQEFD